MVYWYIKKNSYLAIVYIVCMYYLIDKKEREGFEPSVAFETTSVFKTDALNRSAIFPYSIMKHNVNKTMYYLLGSKCTNI